MSFELDIFLLGEAKQGWGPIGKMVQIAARTLEARLFTVPERNVYSRTFMARGLLVGSRRRAHGRHALVIAGVPGKLRVVLHRPLWLAGYETVSAWVIDSFWDDHVPQLLYRRPHFDHVWVADEEDVAAWQTMFPSRVSVLPWGTDSLGASQAMDDRGFVERDIDLLRVGRQPPAFDDDDAVAAVARSAGLTFHGRPPFGDGAEESQRILERYLMRARTVMAFTNLVDQTIYTHPTKEYVTGRWTDALAFGTIPVGKRPNTVTSRLLVPDELCLEVDYMDIDRAAAQLRVYLDDPEFDTMTRNAMRHARTLLDWRYRLRDMCEEMGWAIPQTLRRELVDLKEIS